MHFDLAAQPDLASLLRVNLTYFWRHGRLPSLERPTRFTELVQLRKLYDRDVRMPIMADKVAMKSIVKERLGLEWVVPMLWSGGELPPESLWAQPIVIKARHGCNQNVVVRDAKADWSALRTSSERWTRRAYGRWLDEWLYTEIPRGLLIEPFIGTSGELPIDYKVYVFHGEATHVQAHLGRATDHRWVVHDRHWHALSGSAATVKRPSALAAMLAAAEVLAEGFSFVRVDFYQPDDHPLFGEMTFYPGSGLDPFDPPWLDQAMGRLWLNPGDRGLTVGQTIAVPRAA